MIGLWLHLLTLLDTWSVNNTAERTDSILNGYFLDLNLKGNQITTPRAYFGYILIQFEIRPENLLTILLL